jgi:hypothetical protein
MTHILYKLEKVKLKNEYKQVLYVNTLEVLNVRVIELHILEPLTQDKTSDATLIMEMID